MPEIDEGRYRAVYQYVMSQGKEINTWTGMADIIATAIEIALNHSNTTTNN